MKQLDQSHLHSSASLLLVSVLVLQSELLAFRTLITIPKMFATTSNSEVSLSLRTATSKERTSEHWKKAYESCLQSNKPSIDELISNMKSHQCFSSIQSVRSFKKQVLPNNESYLRGIQLQIRLRLTLWLCQGEVFVRKYQKRMLKKQRTTKNNKPSGSNALSLLSQDVAHFFELAVFQLEPETSAFDSFLKTTITKDLQSLPLHFIWDTFEKENPFTISKTPVLSPLRLKSKKRKQQPESQDATKPQKPQAQKMSLSSDKENMDSLSIPVSVPLIAPRKKTKGTTNSLLGAPKSYFVGSHFNTNLTNAQSLFRQVPVHKHRPTTSSNALRTTSKPTKQQKSVSSNFVPPTPGSYRIPSVVPETPHHPKPGNGQKRKTSMMVVGNNCSMPPPPPRTASQVVAEALSSLQRREQRRHRMH
jgi:hypothetical protein